MRCNVELLKVIQIGLTLCDGDGNLAPEPCTWQFNFRFDLNEDMYTPDAIELLRLANVDFARHEEIGVEPDDFAELLITSGLVLTDETTWISYASQNDFGYLLKVLTAAPLPAVESEFHDLLAIWFPRLYDVKYIVRSIRLTKGGLQELADEFQITRTGPAHQAGSDSLMTAAVFFKIREAYFLNEDLDEMKYSGHIYGISGDSSFMPTAMSNIQNQSNTISHSSQSIHAQYAAAQVMAYRMYQ